MLLTEKEQFDVYMSANDFYVNINIFKPAV